MKKMMILTIQENHVIKHTQMHHMMNIKVLK